MMLIRSEDHRLVPVDGAGWPASSGVLDLRLAGTTCHAGDGVGETEPVHLVARTRLGVDVDARSRVLDVDLIGLPADLLVPLGRYAVPRRLSPSGGPVALDPDGAWLWIHVQEGSRASRHRGLASVRFTFEKDRLAAIRAMYTRGNTEHAPGP
jgi:hypothetical protein